MAIEEQSPSKVAGEGESKGEDEGRDMMKEFEEELNGIVNAQAVASPSKTSNANTNTFKLQPLETVVEEG